MFVALFGIGLNAPVLGFHSCAEVPPFEGGPSQDITSPVRVTTILIATIGQLNGAVQAPLIDELLPLLTVTLTKVDVV
jgi:hypothetical protein